MTLDSKTPSSNVPVRSEPGPLPWWGAVSLLIPIALSVLLCWLPSQRLRAEYLAESWPVAEATIVSSQIRFRNEPGIGKHPPWTGWCVSWHYAYPWKGGKIGGILEDSTPSTLSAGCFSYRESAERQASRRMVGSTLRVRIDPSDPWLSTAAPAGIHVVDVVLLLLGLIPAGLAIYSAGVRLRELRSAALPASCADLE